MTFDLSPQRAALLFAGLWMLYAVPQVKHHGLAIDSPSLFYAGDRTLFWLQHPGHPEALDFNFPAPEPAGFHSAFFPFPDKNDPLHYPVFAGLIAAFVAQITGAFGVDPVDGHHLGLVLLHAIGLFWFTLLAGRVFGRRAALYAGAMLLCFPEAIGQAFNNAKDWPCADFYGCAMLSALEAFLWRRRGTTRTAGIFAGLALSCKLNGVFALVCIGGLGAYVFWEHTRAMRRPDFSTLRDLAKIYLIAGLVFFLLWPYLYHGPMSGWLAHLEGYLQWYLAYGKSPRDTWTDYPFRSLIFATPPIVLLCALAGMFGGLKAQANERTAFWFVVVWIAFPILRSVEPHSNFYDGNRHFLEYIPGLCLLAGLGVDWLLARIADFSAQRPALTGRALRLGLAAILLAAFILPVATYRPFEETYFNLMIGGLGGAQSRALFDMPLPHDTRVRGTEGDYWYGNLGDGLPHLRELLGPDQAGGEGGSSAGTRGFATCGPAPQQYQMQWLEGFHLLPPQPSDQDLLYVSPREVFCGLGLVRALEGRRPILFRAERGGGLIYEILGPDDGKQHTVVTPPSLYEADRLNWGHLS